MARSESKDAQRVRAGQVLAERVVTQVLDAGECIGDAPGGKVWVFLHHGNEAQPEARSWEWIERQLNISELKIVRAALAGNPSHILFISVDGCVAVVRQDHQFVTLPPPSKWARA